jgi:hypothetical protein
MGSVLTLAPADWRYHDGARPLTLQVVGIRHDLSRWYGGQWVWVEGHEVERPGGGPAGASDADPDSGCSDPGSKPRSAVPGGGAVTRRPRALKVGDVVEVGTEVKVRIRIVEIEPRPAPDGWFELLVRWWPLPMIMTWTGRRVERLVGDQRPQTAQAPVVPPASSMGWHWNAP